MKCECMKPWPYQWNHLTMPESLFKPLQGGIKSSMFRMWNKAQFGTLTSVNLCSSSSFSPSLTTPLQTPCWSQWPAWLFTPATSSCRSTLWLSFTTSRLSSDTATLAVCLWLPVRPPASPACLRDVSWALRQDFFLLLFKADSMTKVNALHIVLKVKLGEVISWGCFPFTETFGLKGRGEGCAWFRFMCCFCLLKSSAPHSLENMLIMWTSDYAVSLFFILSRHQTLVV